MAMEIRVRAVDEAHALHQCCKRQGIRHSHDIPRRGRGAYAPRQGVGWRVGRFPKGVGLSIAL